MTSHQLKQQIVIDQIASQISQNSLAFSTVSPVADYATDPRICLTSVHLPDQSFLAQVQQTLIEPLQKIEPNFYFYPNDCLHLTIKNIRVINSPPRFTKEDINVAERIFAEVIPQHHQFKVYFYRLLLFPNNLALIGTTDPELDKIILNLDDRLTAAGLPDDKIYSNSQYFFCNLTLARFNQPPSPAFKQKIEALSKSIKFEPYAVDSVTLLTCNAVLKKKKIRGSWKLK